MITRASRLLSFVRPGQFRSINPFAGVRPKLLFSTNVSPANRIHEAVRDFLQLRRSELEEYEAVDPTDKEETQKLIEKISIAKVDDTTTWSSLGFDGLDEVEVVLAIEEALGITLPDEEFHTVRSVADAIAVFSKYTPKRG
jgi:acyl carrier protein